MTVDPEYNGCSSPGWASVKAAADSTSASMCAGSRPTSAGSASDRVVDGSEKPVRGASNCPGESLLSWAGDTAMLPILPSVVLPMVRATTLPTMAYRRRFIAGHLGRSGNAAADG